MSGKGLDATPREIAERFLKEERVLVVVHEAPDGDALGCLSAFVMMCERLGIPCESYVPGSSVFPDEYTFLPGLGQVQRERAPEIAQGTTIYFLDCASMLRGGSDGFPAGATRVNIDHHQDNPSYGDLNLVDSSAASATTILYEIFKAGDLKVDSEIATALYVGLVTDSGRFQYSNTTPQTHRVAAELQELGCDVAEVSRRVYETVALPKVLLLGRVLSRLKVRLGGALVTSWLDTTDFAEVGAHEGHSEGLIDTLRGVAGAKVAALARQRQGERGVEAKVSLRATDESVDVAALAHERGGGGHVRAAGFTAEGGAEAVLDWVEQRLTELL